MPVWEIVFICAGVFIVLGPAVSSFFTPKSDLAHIKAAFEGPNGRAGADMSVLAIERAGEGRTGRLISSRVYRVTLEGPNGDRLEKKVGVDIQLFGTGNLHELP
jgi:hypothetical protein